MSFKKCQVVMLPTNKKAQLFTIKNGLGFSDPAIENVNKSQNQHLYITSDDEIKEGDWVILKVSDKRPLYCVKLTNINSVDKTATVLFPSDKSTIEVFISGCKKIISTTDSSLTINKRDSHPNSIWKIEGALLPQPSQSFIKVFVREYNKGNIITDVLVEYEKHFDEDWSDISGAFEIEYETLKVNPKDNTITIKKVKDSWNKNEVKKLCKKAYNDGFYQGTIKDSPCKDNSFWIEENL